jgi:hypothetical protein
MSAAPRRASGPRRAGSRGARSGRRTARPCARPSSWRNVAFARSRYGTDRRSGRSGRVDDHGSSTGNAIWTNATGRAPGGRSAGSAMRSRYRSASGLELVAERCELVHVEVQQAVAERRGLGPVARLRPAPLDPLSEPLRVAVHDEAVEDERCLGKLLALGGARPRGVERGRAPRPLPAGPSTASSTSPNRASWRRW